MDYLRVTEVIKPFNGIEFVEENLLSTAAERGTRVHSHIEAILDGFDLEVVDEDISGYLQSFKDFWKNYKHVLEGSSFELEKRLNCDKLGITGKPDLIASTRSRTYIIDWKTSSRPQKSWYIQGAAYRYLAEENGYPDVDNVLFVNLKRDGSKALVKKSESHTDNLDIFNKCLELYKFFEMDKTRRRF